MLGFDFVQVIYICMRILFHQIMNHWDFSALFLFLNVRVEGFPKPWHSLKHNIPQKDVFQAADTKNLAGVLSSADKYFVIRKRMTWIEAQDACYQFCSRLATFPTKEKAAYVGQSLSHVESKNIPDLPDDYFTVKDKYEWGRDRRYWIGLTDLGKEGVWRWSRTNELLTYDDMWYPHQPDHFNKQKLSLQKREREHAAASEHCVSFWNPVFYIDGERHTFNDEPCNMLYYALCDPQPKNQDQKKMSDDRGWPCTQISASTG